MRWHTFAKMDFSEIWIQTRLKVKTEERWKLHRIESSFGQPWLVQTIKFQNALVPKGFLDTFSNDSCSRWHGPLSPAQTQPLAVMDGDTEPSSTVIRSRKSVENVSQEFRRLFGTRGFDNWPAEAIIVWLKVRWIPVFLFYFSRRRACCALQPVWTQNSISAMEGVVCSWLARRCASAKVISWLLKRIKPLMAPVGPPCRRLRYFKHFIQPLGGIVTCTHEQLPIVKGAQKLLTAILFGNAKIHGLGGICLTMCELCFAQRDLSLPV